MDFFEQVDLAQALVERHERVSRRGLLRQFGNHEDLVDEIADELRVRGVADWEGDTLVHADAATSTPVIEEPLEHEPVTDPDHGDAQLRHLTVMFCDVMGSTQLSGELDPERFTVAMRAFLDVATTVIEGWGGSVGNYMGDGIIAYFGYPVALEDAANRAVRAGLQMLDELPEINAGLRTRVDHELQIRIGIHTGPVLVDRYGGAAHAMGQTANIAARVESAALPDSVVISPSTRRLVSGVFVTEELGSFSLKGVAEPLELTRVLQVGGVPPRLGAGRNLQTALVARDVELALLADRWARVRRGEGQAVLVVGEPGIGKSRLVDAFQATVAESPHSWFDTSCSPYATSATLHPIADLQARGLGFSLAGPPDEKREALHAALEAVDLDPDRGIALLAGMHDLDVEHHELDGFERVELRDLLLDWLVALARRQPSIFFVDDLHWADPTTVDLLSALVDRIVDEPVLLIMTSRPEGLPDLGTRSQLMTLNVSRLSAEETTAIVTHEAPELDPEVVEAIVERADGVPLFVEELTAAARDSRGGGFTIPDSLENLLLSRLARVTSLTDVAQAASVIGREFTAAELRLVEDIDADELDTLLERGVAQEFFFRRGSGAGEELIFRHALLRDAVYGTMVTEVRERLHARYARGLITSSPSVAASRPDLVAEHLTLGGETLEASRWWQTAAERASAAAATTEAERFYVRAIETADPDDLDRRLELSLARGGALNAILGNGHRDAAPVWDEIVELATRIGDREKLALAHAGRIGRGVSSGDFTMARAEAQRALELAGESYQVLRMIVLGAEALMLNFEGWPERTIALAESLLAEGFVADDRFDRAMGRSSEAQLGMFHSYALAQVGRFRDALAEADRIADNRGAVGPATSTSALTIRSTISLLKGDFVTYGKISQEFLDSARRFDLQYLIAMGSITTTVARLIVEPDPRELAKVHATIETMESTGNMLAVPVMLWSLAQAELACGVPERAEFSLVLAGDVAAATGQRWYEGQIAASLLRARRLLGRIPDDWRVELDAARDFTRERGLRVGALHVAAAKFEQLQGCSDEPEARAEVEAALDALPEHEGSPTIAYATSLLS